MLEREVWHCRPPPPLSPSLSFSLFVPSASRFVSHVVSDASKLVALNGKETVTPAVIFVVDIAYRRLTPELWPFRKRTLQLDVGDYFVSFLKMDRHLDLQDAELEYP